MIPSPCIGICQYEDTEGILERTCKGCYRTAEEIEEWYLASEDRRKEILRACQQRKRQEEYKKDLTILLRTTKILRE